MPSLENLKNKIDEANYPYFDEDYLTDRLNNYEAEGQTYNNLVRELLLLKSNIEEIKLGDVIIPSPRNHFLMLASKYRDGYTGNVVRADEG